MVSITKDVEVELCADEVAGLFWDLDEDEMAVFFNYLAKGIEQDLFLRHMSLVFNSKKLRDSGRKFMQTIGEAAGMKEG